MDEDSQTHSYLSEDNGSDIFDGFEVESGSEKEFLISHLKHHTDPSQESILRAALDIPEIEHDVNTADWDTTMTPAEFEEALVASHLHADEELGEFDFISNATLPEIDARIQELTGTQRVDDGSTSVQSLKRQSPLPALKKMVQDFANAHSFNESVQNRPTTLQRRQYTRDIYDYARAIGMGRHWANVEVKMARAAYRRKMGMSSSLRLDQSDDESSVELEIDDAVDYLASLKKGMRHGIADAASAWSEVRRLHARSQSNGNPEIMTTHEGNPPISTKPSQIVNRVNLVGSDFKKTKAKAKSSSLSSKYFQPESVVNGANEERKAELKRAPEVTESESSQTRLVSQKRASRKKKRMQYETLDTEEAKALNQTSEDGLPNNSSRSSFADNDTFTDLRKSEKKALGKKNGMGTGDEELRSGVEQQLNDIPPESSEDQLAVLKKHERPGTRDRSLNVHELKSKKNYISAQTENGLPQSFEAERDGERTTAQSAHQEKIEFDSKVTGRRDRGRKKSSGFNNLIESQTAKDYHS